MKFTLAVVSVLAVCGCAGAQGKAGSGSAGGSASARAAAPVVKEVTLVPMKFDKLQELLASKRGKIVVLDAWSTYCEPCMKEFPGLVALHKKYGPDKVACVSLCANFSGIGDVNDEIKEPLAFLKAQNATFDNILSADPDTKLYANLKIASVPTIFVYDGEGKLLKTFEGEPKYADVEKFVAPLVK